MDTAVKPLEELIKELSPDLKVEVREFVESLLIKHDQPQQKKLRQDWAGALQAYRPQYTSLELQHLVSTWREN